METLRSSRGIKVQRLKIISALKTNDHAFVIELMSVKIYTSTIESAILNGLFLNLQLAIIWRIECLDKKRPNSKQVPRCHD